MSDRKKVISEFSECVQRGGWMHCGDCEYKNEKVFLTCKPLAKEILALLKEQETVEHALEVLRKAGWTETQDVPFPAELLKEQEAEKKCCKDCEYYGNCHDT